MTAFIVVFSVITLLFTFHFYLKFVTPEITFIDIMTAPVCQVTPTRIILNRTHAGACLTVLGEAYYYWMQSRSIIYWLKVSLFGYCRFKAQLHAKLYGIATHSAYLSDVLSITYAKSQQTMIRDLHHTAVYRYGDSYTLTKLDLLRIYHSKTVKYITKHRETTLDFAHRFAKRYQAHLSKSAN